MAKPKQRQAVTINLAAIDLAYSPGLVELLEVGTAQEIRQALDTIAFYLDHGNASELGPKIQAALGEILRQIGSGADANKAFGLNRKKKYGAWYAKQMEWLIKDLMKQGITRIEAEDLMGRLNIEKELLEDRAAADERIRKRIARARTK